MNIIITAILIVCAIIFIGAVYLLWVIGKDLKATEDDEERGQPHQRDISTQIIKSDIRKTIDERDHD